MEERIKLRTEYIKLDQALKHVLCLSGGEVKDIIAYEDVYVNGEIERRRGKKLRDGDKVEYLDTVILIEE